jgi:hypothetical protein
MEALETMQAQQAESQAQQARFQAQLQAMQAQLEQFQAQPKVGDTSGATAGQAASSPSPQAAAGEEEREPTAEARPAESDKRSGKLDTATLNCFPQFGVGDLYYAEEWIAQAERLGEKLQLDKEMLCRAFCLRAVGEVKTYLEQAGLEGKGDWSSLCMSLKTGFGRDVRMPKYEEELATMGKFAGMKLGLAVARLDRLLEAVGHSPTNLQPVRALLKRFPDVLRVAVHPYMDKWMTYHDALKDLAKIATSSTMQDLEVELVAKPAPKASMPAPKVETVAAVEPAGNPKSTDQAELVAAIARLTGKPMRGAGGKRTMKCYRCLKQDHFWKQCPIKVEEENSDKLSKKWVG